MVMLGGSGSRDNKIMQGHGSSLAFSKLIQFIQSSMATFEHATGPGEVVG